MKIQIIYSSRSGCTRKLAEAIFEGIEAEKKTIHDVADGVPVLDGDIILFGYWAMMGAPDEQMQRVMASAKGKAVGVFCTLGYYSESSYARRVLDAGLNLVKNDNTIIGSYVSNGAVSDEQIAKQRQGGPRGFPSPEKELRWEMMKGHPTSAECALAAERFRERIRLYQRCNEKKIEFTSIL